MACPWSCACDPPPPLIKVASNTKPCSKLGGTTLNGREEGGQYYISQTCDQERFEARKVIFSWECLDSFATGCSFIWHCYWKFMLRITKRNFWGPNVLRFSGGECPIPNALRSSFINLDKNTTLGTSLCKKCLLRTWSKLVDDCRKLSNKENKQNRSNSTDHKRWPFELVQVNICFLGSPLTWLTGQKSAKEILYV